jgi:uridylate kinase
MYKYKRILLKLSGEALQGEKQHGIDEVRLIEYAEQIKQLLDNGVEVGIVIGGGNIFRGISGQEAGFERFRAIIWACWQR